MAAPRAKAKMPPRQRQVLRLAADGASNAQIAAKLDLSENTVKNHLRAAYKRLGVSKRRDEVSTYGVRTAAMSRCYEEQILIPAA